jgi:hypothetical protein
VQNCKLSKEYESTLVSKTVFSTEPAPESYHSDPNFIQMLKIRTQLSTVGHCLARAPRRQPMSTAPWPSHDANGQRLVACARGRDTRCRTHICSLAKCATAAGSRLTACARHRHARAFAKLSLPLGRAHECVRLTHLWMPRSQRLRIFLAQDDATRKVVGSRASVCASGGGRLTRRRRSNP